MMKKSVLVKFVCLLLAAVAGLSLTGCAGLKESDVSYAGPMLDNILACIQDKDLSGFSKDFDDTLKKDYTEDVFNSFVSLLEEKIGGYESKSFEAAALVTENDVTFTKVIYKAKYTKENGSVLITLVFDEVNGQKKVAGLFFSSPNLAKQ